MGEREYKLRRDGLRCIMWDEGGIRVQSMIGYKTRGKKCKEERETKGWIGNQDEQQYGKFTTNMSRPYHDTPEKNKLPERIFVP